VFVSTLGVQEREEGKEEVTDPILEDDRDLGEGLGLALDHQLQGDFKAQRIQGSAVLEGVSPDGKET